MQAGVDVVMGLHEGFEADLARTAHEGVVGAYVHFDIALTSFVMSLSIIKRAIYRLRGCG